MSFFKFCLTGGLTSIVGLLTLSLAACGGGDTTYAIGGTLSGLNSSKVTLLNSGADALSLSENGSFVFAKPAGFGMPYKVTVGTQPLGFQWCTVASGAGVAHANVNIPVMCGEAAARVSTFAGFGDAATLSSPFSIAVDEVGNLYLADYGAHLIRKIDRGGNITTFAGSGTPGSSDGLGMAASFSSPTGIASDSSGNLYVVDQGNNLIRKIDTDGAVTTLARSEIPGLLYGIAIGLDGHIYVTDQGAHLIRKIDTDGNITTHAGTGTPGSNNGQGLNASFNGPTGIVGDKNGNLYVSDFGGHLIRKIGPTGSVTTLAGSANNKGSTDRRGENASFDSPVGLAIDAVGNLYVADSGNHLIRKIDLNGNVTTIAGGAAEMPGLVDGLGRIALFDSPLGVAIDKTSALYVADTVNKLVRKIDAVQP